MSAGRVIKKLTRPYLDSRAVPAYGVSKSFHPEMEMQCLSSILKPFSRSSDQSNSGKTDEHGNLASHSMLDLPARGKR